MHTKHQVVFENATNMTALETESVDLVTTSPPYPMVEMWDDMFSQENDIVGSALGRQDVAGAFEAMHQVLDPVWGEAFRVLKPGGFACINIGDATRTINGKFVLYPNHVRIMKKMLELGFTALPCILWRKQTNAPNKFMGSGMLPAGAYVTLEHEYILILRKGPKREFKKIEDRKIRRQSAMFWEERNAWYSDVWFDIKGTPQALSDNNARKRSAAYPFEIAYRLINMYSAKGDVILDPFLGTGTTVAAAMASGRNSIGYEIDKTLNAMIDRVSDAIVESSNLLIRQRLARHVEFVHHRTETKGGLKHANKHYGFPVMTAQEKELLFNDLLEVKRSDNNIYEVDYIDGPQLEFCNDRVTESQGIKISI